jgi:hypothetical protein
MDYERHANRAKLAPGANAMTEIVSPFQQFFDTTGAPLANGMIYVGTANQDAETNPIAVYWDDALTIPAPQPIRTLNGYPAWNGAPSRLYISQDAFSLTVRNAQGRIMYSAANVTGLTTITQDIASLQAEITTYKADIAAPSGSSLVGFLPAGTGAGARTAEAKMRDAISVKDFGAVGDGVTNDSAAFAAAAAFSNYVVVPKGTYRLNTDVSAPNVVFEFQDATLTGEGELKSANIINYGAGINYASNQSAFFQSNGHVKSLADVAVTNLGEYPRKYFPTAAYIELLRLSPGVTKFETQNGATLEAMNETYFREMLREMADNGIRSIIVPYVAYIGFWFYKPSFAYPYDYDTSRNGQFWGDWLTGYPNVQAFDAIRVMLDECAKLGMQVYLGLTRNGDSPLMNDLYAANILGTPDPLRFGLTLAARLTNAINQTREIAADLVAQYGHFPSFAGFYISHEPDHIGASNNYLTPVTGTGGVNPSLRSYSKPIMLAPSSPLDLAATSTFANAMVATGCDIIMPQDSVGPGYNFTTNVYTYVPSVPLGQIAAHFSTWKTVSDIANAKQTLTNRSLRFWVTAEVWQMGVVQNTTLTLSAVSGASVTATAGVNSFLFSDVGKWISTADGGNAQITAFTSSTVVTVSTTVGGGRAFGSTSQSANNWSLNSQYANNYPANFSRFQSQLLEEWPYIEAVALYAWFGFLDSGTLFLRLSQGNSGFTDYRTKATTLYSSYRAWQQGQRAKYNAAPDVAILQQQFFERGSAAATSLTDDFATFYPRHDGSRVTYICTIRGFLASGTSTLTIGLRVNGILVKSTQDVIISNHAGGTYSFMYSELPKGLSRTVGISFSSTSANFTLLGAEILAMEMV